MNAVRLLMIYTFSLPAVAQFAGLQSLDFMKPGMRWECKEFEWLGNYNPGPLMAKAAQMKPGCKQAEIYYNVIYEVINGPHVKNTANQSPEIKAIEKEARLKMIISLATMSGNRRDTVEIVNQANRYLDKYGDRDENAFLVHYYLISAIQKMVRSSSRSQDKNLIAIGEHPRQRKYSLRPVLDIVNGQFVMSTEKVANDKGPNRFSKKMYRMSFNAFIEKYDGKVGAQGQQKVEQVKDWQNETAGIYADHFIDRGDTNLARNEPFAAIYWYTQLTQRGPFEETNGRLVYGAYDLASTKVAESFIVAAQNFLGLKPNIKVRGSFLERVLVDVEWAVKSKHIDRNDSDITRWLQMDEDYNPANPNHKARAELAEIALCSALSVYGAAANGRSSHQLTNELKKLPGKLQREKTKLERKAGRSFQCG